MYKYPDRKAVKESTYPKQEDYLKTFAQAPLKNLIYKKVFPSKDDAKDCGPGSSSAGSSSGVGGLGQ